MPRKLFLLSSGLDHALSPQLAEFIGQPLQGLKLAYIPNAIDPEPMAQMRNRQTKKELTDLGFKVTTVDLRHSTGKNLKKILNECDVIYVRGGNTYYLLHLMRESGFDQMIGELLDSGKIYIGNSAGSIVAGPDITVAGWEPWPDSNILNLDDLTGLDLINFSVMPHYHIGDEDIVKTQEAKHPHRIARLADGQALAIKDNDHHLITSN